MELLCSGAGLGELGLSSLEKRRLWETFKPFQVPKEAPGELEKDSGQGPGVPGHGNGFKQNEDHIRFAIWKNNFPTRVGKHCQRGCPDKLPHSGIHSGSGWTELGATWWSGRRPCSRQGLGWTVPAPSLSPGNPSDFSASQSFPLSPLQVQFQTGS